MLLSQAINITEQPCCIRDALLGWKLYSATSPAYTLWSVLANPPLSRAAARESSLPPLHPNPIGGQWKWRRNSQGGSTTTRERPRVSFENLGTSNDPEQLPQLMQLLHTCMLYMRCRDEPSIHGHPEVTRKLM